MYLLISLVLFFFFIIIIIISGLSVSARRSVHHSFLRDEVQVVVATIAFGMVSQSMLSAFPFLHSSLLLLLLLLLFPCLFLLSFFLSSCFFG